MLLGLVLTVAMGRGCFLPEAREVCCPSACELKEGRNWPKANELLHTCMEHSMGCSRSQYRNVTVASFCNCRR